MTPNETLLNTSTCTILVKRPKLTSPSFLLTCLNKSQMINSTNTLLSTYFILNHFPIDSLHIRLRVNLSILTETLLLLPLQFDFRRSIEPVHSCRFYLKTSPKMDKSYFTILTYFSSIYLLRVLIGPFSITVNNSDYLIK